MRTRLPASLALLLSITLAACASEEETSQPGGRFDDVKGAPASGDSNKDEKPEAAPATPDSPAAPGAATPPADAPPATDPPRTCRAARDLGALSGDTGTTSVSAHGQCSDWLRVRVTEDWNGPTAGPMKMTATLISPDKEDFDVFVYLNTEADVLECAAVQGKSELPSGRSDIVKSQWGEQYTFNNASDARTVSVEVRKKSGTCANAAWALLLQGNY